jgi:isopentenyldiphosphate isomerase
LNDYDSASDAVESALRVLAQEGLIEGWRGERYGVSQRFGDPAVLSVERAGCAFLGFRSWGFHLNGYVRKPDGMYLWIAERAHDKPSYPGMLVNTVAGGHPEGLTLAENLIKECAEEASIPADMAAQAHAVGAISYLHETSTGLKPDQMFSYDLELDESFTPIPADGEVAAFYLMPAREVMEIVRDTDRFKFNCAPILIDFFIRHGLIDPDEEADYVGLCDMLHGSAPE